VYTLRKRTHAPHVRVHDIRTYNTHTIRAYVVNYIRYVLCTYVCVMAFARLNALDISPPVREYRVFNKSKNTRCFRILLEQLSRVEHVRDTTRFYFFFQTPIPSFGFITSVRFYIGVLSNFTVYFNFQYCKARKQNMFDRGFFLIASIQNPFVWFDFHQSYA